MFPVGFLGVLYKLQRDTLKIAKEEENIAYRNAIKRNSWRWPGTAKYKKRKRMD
jgi:hypothetical protein